MAWDDRLREASYTSPSGNNIAFMYEDVSCEFDKKTTAFNFPDADGTYVQDLGNSSRRFPLRIFLSGNDYDLEANLLFDLLREIGVGRLSHPIYGVFDVVPFGSIKRIDALKTAANQAIFEVTFWQTIGLIYPTSQSDATSDVLNSIFALKQSSAEQFENYINIDNVFSAVSLKGYYQSNFNAVVGVLEPISTIQNDTVTLFNTITRSINIGIDTLIQDPLTLAFQTIELIKVPANVVTNIAAKLEAYGSLFTNIINNAPASKITSTITSSNNVEQSNQFHNNDLFLSTLISGEILSVVNHQFETKTDALLSADHILTQVALFTNWRDESFEALSQIDTGGSYQKLQEAAALVAGYLVEISFSLKQEKRIILDRDRTIIDLCAEIYGNIDDNIDFLINSNNLTGSQILELPRGFEVVFYI